MESQTSDKRINVLVLITAMDRAGAETMMMNYLRHIDKDKVHMDFVVNRDYESDYEQEIKELGSNVYHLSPIYPNTVREYKKECLRLFPGLTFAEGESKRKKNIDIEL